MTAERAPRWALAISTMSVLLALMVPVLLEYMDSIEAGHDSSPQFIQLFYLLIGGGALAFFLPAWALLLRSRTTRVLAMATLVTLLGVASAYTMVKLFDTWTDVLAYPVSGFASALGVWAVALYGD